MSPRVSSVQQTIASFTIVFSVLSLACWLGFVCVYIYRHVSLVWLP